MRVYAQFSIENSDPSKDPLGLSARIKDERLYEQIRNIVLRCLPKTSEPGGWSSFDGDRSIEIKSWEESPVLRELHECILQAGLSPYFELAPPENATFRKAHYWVRRIRVYTPKEYDLAEFLCLRDWGGDFIAGFAGRNGTRWIGRGDVPLKKRVVGRVEGINNYFVNADIRAHLERALLKGIQFHPLEWDNPESPRGEYYELDSEFVMPPCQLPLKRLSGRNRDGSEYYFNVYDDCGYHPEEFLFRAEDMKAMKDFDIALTREVLTTNKANYGIHRVIISQRFRQVIKALRIRDVSYNLVRLV